jgi:plastocyanin
MEVAMRGWYTAPVTLPLLVVIVGGSSVPAGAGPEKITYPANWKNHVLYTTVDRHDVKQYRELYASSQAAVDAMKEGKPLPDGTVLTLIQHKAQVDAAGVPIKGPDGRFVKGDVVAIAVMEKREGWGAEYPAELRNGNWEYAAFSAEGKLNEKANYKGCFQCHKPHEAQDYVISLAAIRRAGESAAQAGSSADVNISGFAFAPNTITVAPGKPVTWLNGDGSPHQITITSTKERSPIVTKGQRTTVTFGTPGTYDYICGLHPSMKATVEVK